MEMNSLLLFSLFVLNNGASSTTTPSYVSTMTTEYQLDSAVSTAAVSQDSTSCSISIYDLMERDISIDCSWYTMPYQCPTQYGDYPRYLLSNGDNLPFFCTNANHIITKSYVVCMDGSYGDLPDCLDLEPFLAPTRNALIGVTLALVTVSLVLIATLVAFWKKMHPKRTTSYKQEDGSNTANNHTQMTEDPIANPRAPQVPKRPQNDTLSPTPNTVSAALLDTEYTAPGFKVFDGANNMAATSLYEYIEPKSNDYYLEIMS